MPSAKLSDGSLVSLSSLNDIQSRGTYCEDLNFSICAFIIDSFQLLFVEKSEEEKQKEVELYRQLKKRKNELEEKLLAKLDELREVCIKEAVNILNLAC